MAAKPVSQPTSIHVGSPGAAASKKDVVATVAGRGISAGVSTSSAPAQPLAGAQPLTYDFHKRYCEAYEFYKAQKSSEAIEVLVEILEKAKGVTFAANNLNIVKSQIFLAILYKRDSDASIDYAKKAIEGIGTIFANRASWNQATITSTYKELWKDLGNLKSLIPSKDPMRQNIKEKLAICEEELRKRLSKNELEELFPASREETKDYAEVSPLQIFVCLALAAVVYAIFFRSLSIVKIN